MRAVSVVYRGRMLDWKGSKMALEERNSNQQLQTAGPMSFEMKGRKETGWHWKESIWHISWVPQEDE